MLTGKSNKTHPTLYFSDIGDPEGKTHLQTAKQENFFRIKFAFDQLGKRY